ncbi:disease resistance protein RPS2-like [Macadamia integrifolia]|uniref:disease resistance protein RPS2-like n=1 Tax=Macadamia integrifolia TaxID=60698 RepID=UPI001C4EB525|nr:disease resistance protein RPS2-like [Macadamia integrifolia]
MDFVGPFVNIIDTYLIAPFVRRISYLRHSSDNVNGLQIVVQNLKARRNDEQSKLKAEENVGQVKTDVGSNWFKNVQEIEEEADGIEKEYQQQGRCAGGWCVNCWSHYKLSKRSLILKLKANDRLNEQFVVARPPSPKPVIEMPTETTIMENQSSTQSMLQQILDCISDPEIGVFGVYGMGGVGKTTLAKQVNNHFKENNSCFETVIMVTVSATPHIPSIQTSIGNRLGLPDNCGGVDALFEAQRKKKSLLILDDVWRKLKLEDVGILHPAGNKKGSKILVISRNQDTCTDMGASKTIKVQPLPESESWNLFIKVAGDHVAANGINRFAEEIVGRCKGLPLAIVTVAHTMANRHGVRVWENALREMKQSTKDLRGMKEEVFAPLKFSFDSLENDMVRSLFLYCALFPEDYSIGINIYLPNYYRVRDEMLNYCVGDGLADELGSLKAARDKGEDLIQSLKIASMLEDGEVKGSVKMHDMMRELALWITSSEYSDSCGSKFLVRTGRSVEEAPKAQEWVDPTRISLFDTQIEELPELGEKCQKLTTLLLKENRFLIGIPQTNFFQHMDHLSVLEIYPSEKLESIPDSLSCLVNLRVLRLQNCYNLRALPALGNLQQLQVLDLSWCSKLDQEILGGSECEGVISSLRYLNVENSKVSIPVGVISRLHKLEELRSCDAGKIKWRVTGGGEAKKCDIDVGELSQLKNVRSLSITLEDVIISDWFKPLAKKMMQLELIRCRVLKQEALQALNESPNLFYLRIVDCTGVTCLPTRVKRTVIINNCVDLEVLLDGAEDEEVYHYQDFNGDLNLVRLPNLKRLCSVSLSTLNCFSQLWWINIGECNSLKMIFTKGMPRLFNNLDTIIVRSCDRMEVIIEEAGEEEGIVNVNGGVIISPFPKLTALHLEDLPALHELCCSNHILRCPSIEKVQLVNCPKLKKDPLHIQNANGLLLVIKDEEREWRREGNNNNVMEMGMEIQASL